MDADTLGLTKEEFDQYRQLRLTPMDELPTKLKIMWRITKSEFGDTEYTFRRTLVAYLKKQPLEELIEIFYTKDE